MSKTAQKRNVYTIAYGGWYQRTTLHLSEVYDFLAHKKTHLKLSKVLLEGFHGGLHLESVSREAGYLEYVKAVTKTGIEIRYYEDGLYILEFYDADIKKAKRILKTYFKKHFDPAIKYIFSLGAPTPKILANIQTVHPTVVATISTHPEEFEINKNQFGEVYSQITSKDITVFKTPHYIFVVGRASAEKYIRDIYQMQIFFREFKDQLEKYLHIHRTVWEEIAAIKKKKSIRGEEIEEIRFKLDSYKQTVTLINNRIKQMDNYVKTRSSISGNLKIEEYLVTLFQYKFEVLTNTLEYIKEIWTMTTQYLDNAIQIIVEIERRTSEAGIKSLRIVTAIGVIAGLIRITKVPEISVEGMVFFVFMIILALVVDLAIVKVYQRIKYKLNFSRNTAKFG